MSATRLSAEERKTQILEASLNVFAEKGFSGARTKEIAEAAGVSETLIFRYFGSKEKLYEDALQHLFAHHPVEEELEPALAAEDDREFLYTIASHIMMHGRHDERIVRLAMFSGLEGMGLVEDDNTCANVLEDFLKRRMDEGAFRRMDPALTARFFLNCVFLYVSDIHLKLTGPPFQGSDREAAKALVDIFLNGLVPRG